MAGTKEGSLKSKKKILELYGEDFYAKIGKKGGSNGTTGGFAKDRKLARRAGRLGGLKSTRAGIKNGQGKSIKSLKKYKKINVVASGTIHAIKLRSA